MELDFQTCNPLYDKYEESFNNIAVFTLKKLNIECEIILSLSIVDNSYIHELNKEYRKIDRPTDVISFAFLDGEEDRSMLLKSKSIVCLGDIYISFEKAEEQAKEYSHSIDREMCFLFTHGLLHLLGYDHMESNDEKIMFELQDEILKELNILR